MSQEWSRIGKNGLRSPKWGGGVKNGWGSQKWMGEPEAEPGARNGLRSQKIGGAKSGLHVIGIYLRDY